MVVSVLVVANCIVDFESFDFGNQGAGGGGVGGNTGSVGGSTTATGGGPTGSTAVTVATSASTTSSVAAGGMGGMAGAGGAGGAGGMAGGGGAPPILSCTQQYGMAPNYIPCVETPTVCEYGTTTQQFSCAQQCTFYGGECLDAFNNQGMCGHGAQLTCTTTGFSTLICVCSRGCGGGPPCGMGQTCTNSVCV